MEVATNETPDPDFVTGFNEGYTLARHLPDLASHLSQAATDTARGSGFKAGYQQLLVERDRERGPAWQRDTLPAPGREGPAPERPSPER